MNSDQIVSSQEYWDQRYVRGDTGWDVGQITTPLKDYIDQLPDKDISVLIPGCGNAHEAAYLAANGFSDITVIDISTALIQKIEKQLPTGVKIVNADFFEMTGRYDLILEQTFFCAIDPGRRKAYTLKMKEMLKQRGKMAGVLFNRSFENGPPFSGSLEEYKRLFETHFLIRKLEACYNSITPREGSEVFVILEKVNEVNQQ